MNKPIIQSLWIGKELSTIEQLCIASFLHHGHEFHLYTYEPMAGIPNGTQVKDANEIIPSKEIFTCKQGSYAIFADWFRWELLYKKGNIWVDTDLICLKPFIFDNEIVFGLEKKGTAAVGMLQFPPEHKFSEFMKNICLHPNDFLPYDSARRKLRKIKRILLGRGCMHAGWGEVGGPEGFTNALKYFNLLYLAKPFTYFYAIPYFNCDAFFNETLANDVDLFSHSYAVHLWNEILRRDDSFDKNMKFPKNSLFEQLKTRYLSS